MKTSFRLLLAALGVIFGCLVPTAGAHAGEDENHQRNPRAGAACTPIADVGDQVTIDTRSGPQTYRCEQRPGDPCPVWHWVYDPDVPKGQSRPKGCPDCPSSAPPSSAPPSVPPSSAPPASPPVSASPSPAPGPQLPVTGTRPWQIAAVALLIIVVGAGLVRAARRPRRST